ncbi:hypothetical protein GW17_00055366, partial [Ensete ventricosum]
KPSNLTFSTPKRMGEVEYLSSLTYLVKELCISSFDYSTTATESDWEPKGRVATKAEDSTKCEEMQRLQWLQRGRQRNK